MQIVSETEMEEKGGVRYMIRGPDIDWGLITLAPGDYKPPHYHESLAETFYVIEGTTTFILNEEEVDIKAGSAIRLLPTEAHGLKNNSTKVKTKVIFIKEKYLPQDKVNC